MRRLARDTHTRREVLEHDRRFYTWAPGEGRREIDTFTVRLLPNGDVAVIVAYAPPPPDEERPKLLLVS